MRYSISAPAKINLYLDVLSRRDNGYHNIKSVMQAVSIYDEITLALQESSKNKIVLSGSNCGIAWDNKNLVYKACELFIKEAKISGYTFNLFVEKKIPVCAGMAGGSTDAAGTLLLLNQAFDDFFTDDELCNIASKLGADVAFCVNGGTCLCEGIGERLTPLKSFSGKYLVCAIDGSCVSTPEAYALLDEKYGTNCTDSANIDKLISSIENDDLKGVCFGLYNKFESVIMPKLPNVENIKSILKENGAIGTLMSGSGPSVFGIFETEEAQLNGYLALLSKEITAFMCKTI